MHEYSTFLLILHCEYSSDFLAAIAEVQQLLVTQNGVETTRNFRSIPQGSDVTLSCRFSGVPAPTNVGWVRDGVPLNDDVIINEYDTMVTVRNFQNSSVFQCYVENKYGYDIQAVFLCAEVIEGGCIV